MNLTAEYAVSARERFHRAARCLPVDRPPVWLMRQAGRALPEYRKLKETHTFVQLVQNPELAAEVTLQPVRRFGFDAAILFSDILVIPEALGQTYRFRETGGVVMDFAVTSKADIDRLSVERVVEKLSYVDQALRILRQELGGQIALLGFSGSPWTLATFMLEGASVPKYSRALQLFRADKPTYYALAEKLTAAVTEYLRMQIAAGVDALQIFDSHGGHLAPSEFQEASGRWIHDIIAALGAPSTRSASSSGAPVSDPARLAGTPVSDPARCSGTEAGVRASTCPAGAQTGELHRAGPEAGVPPIIVFSLGTHGNWPDLIATGADVIGIDWQTSLTEARKIVPAHLALQGNLSPALLAEATPEGVATETTKVLETLRGRPGHIFNLGHGLTPAAKLENIAALVHTVKGFR